MSASPREQQDGTPVVDRGGHDVQGDGEVLEPIVLEVGLDPVADAVVGEQVAAALSHVLDDRAGRDREDPGGAGLTPRPVEPGDALGGGVGHVGRAVHRPDRGADHQVGHDAPLGQGGQHADLDGSPRGAAGEHERRAGASSRRSMTWSRCWPMRPSQDQLLRAPLQ